MRINFAAALLLSLWLIPSTFSAQESDVQTRTRDILASLNKRKHLAVEKHGIRKERYKEIRSKPVVKQDLKDYSGLYEVHDSSRVINLQVKNDGRVEATGHEPGNGDTQRGRKFTFRDAKIEGALLTAIKVFGDGSTEKFEGVFINLTDVEGVSPSQIEHSSTTFGLGVVGVRVQVAGGGSTDKLFYRLKP